MKTVTLKVFKKRNNLNAFQVARLLLVERKRQYQYIRALIVGTLNTYFLVR